jgi:hypothetical protein
MGFFRKLLDPVVLEGCRHAVAPGLPYFLVVVQFEVKAALRRRMAK